MYNGTQSATTDNRDYTQIDIGDDGRIVVEFHVWNALLEQRVSTEIRLLPQEAKLLSAMLRRHADAAEETPDYMAAVATIA